MNVVSLVSIDHDWFETGRRPAVASPAGLAAFDPSRRTIASSNRPAHEQKAQRTGVIDWRLRQPKLQAAWGMQDIRG